eukprot:Ihof_evm2s150 gene=Ihof_evmTU2s150
MLLEEIGMIESVANEIVLQLQAAKIVVGGHEVDDPLVMGFLLRHHVMKDTHTDSLAALVTVLEHVATSKEVQRDGVVFVLDCTGLENVSCLDSSLLFDIAVLLQDKFPVNVRKVLFVDFPLSLKIAYYINFLFLKPELTEKIQMIPHTDLSKYVDIKSLPKQIRPGQYPFNNDDLLASLLANGVIAIPTTMPFNPIVPQRRTSWEQLQKLSEEHSESSEEECDYLEGPAEEIVHDSIPPRPTGMSTYAVYKTHLAEHLQALVEDELYLTEFAMIEKLAYERTDDVKTSESLANRSRNRYLDVLALEKTRVHLMNESNDYINANYVTCGASSSEMRFISTQGPLASTIEDFWEMVWNEKSPSIVMVTKLVENRRAKCEQYWPNMGEELVLGKMSIKTTSEINSRDDEFITRTFIIRYHPTMEQHEVLQFNFISWPDHGIPQSARALLHLVDIVNERQEEQANPQSPMRPVMVHCSAGIGRTGTFIAVDSCIKSLQ